MKKLPEIHHTEIKSSMIDLEKITLHGLTVKIKKNETLVSEELVHFCALAYKYNDKLVKEIKLYYDNNCIINNTLMEESRLLNYQSKLYNNEVLTVDENNDLTEIYSKWIITIRSLIKKCIQKAGENNIKKALIENKTQIHELAKECLHFNCGILQMNTKTIWWDRERMLHIYSGHVSESFLTYYKRNSKLNNTLFLHGLEEVQELIGRVLDSIDYVIQEHFKKNPEKSFCKKRIKYDNDFYSIRIDNNGKLMMFHRV